jgi:putative MATE family efflux protein
LIFIKREEVEPASVHDLTRGPIPGHLLRMALPMGIGMLFQTLYVLVDLYFVAGLGDAAMAGVAAGANLSFAVMAATQVLGVGTVAMVAQAAGRKDAEAAGLAFNQSLLLSAAGGVLTLVLGLLLVRPYMDAFGADAATHAAGVAYLTAWLPGLALQFAAVSLASALRGVGVARPAMLVQLGTVVLNAILAPVLIAGWGTGMPLGVAGAGWASTIAIAAGVVGLWLWFRRGERFLVFDRRQLAPRPALARRLLGIGLPAGGEFALMFVYTGVVFYALRDHGAAAQAGFGVGSRVMQSVFLPAMAIAFAVAPVAGQNVGAGEARRVRQTFVAAALMTSVLMLVATAVCQWRAEWLVGTFAHDPAVIAVAVGFLGVLSWNFVGQGLIFACSGLFQALGNTVPALLSSASRLLTFVVPALWLSRRPGFELAHLWWLSVATVTGQALLSLGLLRAQLEARMPLR